MGMLTMFIQIARCNNIFNAAKRFPNLFKHIPSITVLSPDSRAHTALLFPVFTIVHNIIYND